VPEASCMRARISLSIAIAISGGVLLSCSDPERQETAVPAPTTGSTSIADSSTTSVEWPVATGVAVRDSVGGWCAMFPADSSLPAPRPGTAVTVVSGDSAEAVSLTFELRDRRTAQCDAVFPQPRWDGYTGYDLALRSDTTAADLPWVGFAVASAWRWQRGTDGIARTERRTDGVTYELRRCAADEGHHFTLWQVDSTGRRTRVAHDYFDWGALVERTCGEGEDGQ